MRMKYLTGLAGPLLSMIQTTNGQFNNPPDVPIWCGKAYMKTNASFEPGGELVEPPKSEHPLLDLQIFPRFNIYSADEEYASFIIDAPLSFIRGSPYTNATVDKTTNTTAPFTTLIVEVSSADTGDQIISGGRNVSINSTSNEFSFSLSKFPPQFTPYNITLFASSLDGAQTYTASTTLTHLPARPDSGSIAKLDNLHGGLWIQPNASSPYAAIFPYTFYTSWDAYLQPSLDSLDAFKALGYNIIHIIPPGGSVPFDPDVFESYLTRMDELGLYLMYDMRHTYTNASSLRTQAAQVMAHPSLLLWYTADEPDGASDPLSAPLAAYTQLKALDPWHPTSLVLNCANFYYAAYSAGADIVLQDAYPVGINASFSTVYATPCNATYGDCGCDGCLGALSDVSLRMDTLARYQTWLGGRKSFWTVPQAFGNESYWPRYPSTGEEVVMTMLGVNHGAKGVAAWSFPTTEGLRDVTSKLARVVARADVTGLLLGTEVRRLEVDAGRVDAAAWVGEMEMLVSVVGTEYDVIEGAVSVELPVEAKGIKEKLWKGEGWKVEGKTLRKDGLEGLEVAILLLEI